MLEPVIKFYGIKGTKFALEKYAKRAQSLKPIMEVIGEEMLESEKELFRTQGASGGEPWSPLEDSSLRRKKGDARILYRTGDEERSLTTKSAPGNLFNATRSFILIGSTQPGVEFQRRGTKNMEVREPIQFRKDQAEHWTDMVSGFIFRGALR